MIMIGVENCGRCKIVKNMFPVISYLELMKKQESTPEIYSIKKAIEKLNPNLDFPIIFSDDLTKIILTKDLLNNLNIQKIRNILKEN